MTLAKTKARTFLELRGYEYVPEDTTVLLKALRTEALILHNEATQNCFAPKEHIASLFEQASLAQMIAYDLALDEDVLCSYQDAAMRTCALTDPREMLILAQMGLAGEVGEISDALKKHYYHGYDFESDHLQKEAGDVLWYLALLCHGLGTTLSHVAAMNIQKLRERYPEGFSSERSRERENR